MSKRHTRTMSAQRGALFCWLCMLSAAVSCGDDSPSSDAGVSAGSSAGASVGTGGTGGTLAGTTGAAGSAGGSSDSGFGGPVSVNTSKLDMLFVIDDSGSMSQEQAALRREFPNLIRKLVSGDHDGDGQSDHKAVTDLHLGVVSSDMGARFVNGSCYGLGKDGVLQHAHDPLDPELACEPSYPTFLTYEGSTASIEQLSQDFGCIATLGTLGCGYEQHLDAALKAVWPASDSRITFLNEANEPVPGHGDGENAGFLRGSDATPSTLVVVVVADEDDCSTFDHRIFAQDGDEAIPFQDQPVNMRCFYNPERLQPLERFLFGFKNLGHARVIFAGIVGVPIDLVDAEARANVDFSSASARDAYYEAILADSRMREQPDPDSVIGPNEDLKIACESPLGRAYPARRFVSLAKRFGADSLIQSICGESFRTPIDLIVEEVTDRVD